MNDHTWHIMLPCKTCQLAVTEIKRCWSHCLHNIRSPSAKRIRSCRSSDYPSTAHRVGRPSEATSLCKVPNLDADNYLRAKGPFTHTLRWAALRCAALCCASTSRASRNRKMFLLARRSAAQRSVCVYGSIEIHVVTSTSASQRSGR